MNRAEVWAVQPEMPLVEVNEETSLRTEDNLDPVLVVGHPSAVRTEDMPVQLLRHATDIPTGVTATETKAVEVPFSIVSEDRKRRNTPVVIEGICEGGQHVRCCGFFRLRGMDTHIGIWIRVVFVGWFKLRGCVEQ
jgi:hypothetical protein